MLRAILLNPVGYKILVHKALFCFLLFLIMGVLPAVRQACGSWDNYGNRIVLHLNNFTLNEVNRIQSILLNKFNISSYLIKSPHSDKKRGYILKIPNKDVTKVRLLVQDHIYLSLRYKIGLK